LRIANPISGKLPRVNSASSTPAGSKISDEVACTTDQVVYAYDVENFQPLSDPPGEAALRKALREKFPKSRQVDRQAAAADIAGFARELGIHIRRMRLNTQSKVYIKETASSQDQKSADYLKRMFRVASAGNLKRWSRVWLEMPPHVSDMIALARKRHEADGGARDPKSSMAENIASLKENGPVPDGWLRGPVGFLIPTPASMLPFLVTARELVKKPGRRSRWLEDIVLVAVAGWLSALTGLKVHQPSYKIDVNGIGTIRTGPLINFLHLINTAFVDAATARDPDRAELDEPTNTAFDGWKVFYKWHLRSGPRFACLGKGIERKPPV